MQSAETELQNTIELRATASEIEAPKPDLGAKAKNYDFEAFFKRNLEKLLTHHYRRTAHTTSIDEKGLIVL